jgi:hypothetical protein
MVSLVRQEQKNPQKCGFFAFRATRDTPSRALGAMLLFLQPAFVAGFLFPTPRRG